MKKTIIILSVLACVAMQAKAYHFEQNGIYYNFIENKPDEVEVTHFIEYWDDDFDGVGVCQGDIIIPDTIIYENKKYQVTSIGEIAFEESQIVSAVIPKSIKKIGWASFRCLNGTLKQIEIQWQNPLELAEVEIDNNFDTNFEQVVLLVPKNTKELYQEHQVWKNFIHIEEKQ